MNMDNYENKGGHNDMPPTSPRPEPPKGQSDNLLVGQQIIYQKPDGTGERLNKAKRLEQTLIKIKEIAEKVYNDCDNCYGDVDTNCDVDCIDCTLGSKAKLAEQILQKISEVIK